MDADGCADARDTIIEIRRKKNGVATRLAALMNLVVLIIVCSWLCFRPMPEASWYNSKGSGASCLSPVTSATEMSQE